MLKTKRSNVIIFAIIVFSMIAMYGYMPLVSAASLDSAKITLSDSDNSVNATSTVELLIDATVDNSNYLTAGMYVRVHYDPTGGAFGDPGGATITCPAETTASSSAGTDFIECVVDAGEFLESTTTKTVIVADLLNPAGLDQSYLVSVSTHQADGTEIMYTGMQVYIIEDVTVSARVDGTLTFTISGLGPYSTKSSMYGVTFSGTSTATTIPFGTLDSTASSTFAQSLSVSTNASDGFSVTVFQDGELQSAAGDNINSYANSPDSTGSSTQAYAWIPPSAELDKTYTYGHMGVTSDDATDVTLDFSSGKYAGLNNIDPLEIMAHDNPTNGTGQGTGTAAVAYTIDISDLQEAGDYSNTLTYICTPTY